VTDLRINGAFFVLDRQQAARRTESVGRLEGSGAKKSSAWRGRGGWVEIDVSERFAEKLKA
jgi:hypothetical protein